jgi:hypothetical protein
MYPLFMLYKLCSENVEEMNDTNDTLKDLINIDFYKKKFIKQSQCNERAPKPCWDSYYQGLAVNYGTSKGLLTPWVLDFIHQL